MRSSWVARSSLSSESIRASHRTSRKSGSDERRRFRACSASSCRSLDRISACNRWHSSSIDVLSRCSSPSITRSQGCLTRAAFLNTHNKKGKLGRKSV